MANDGKGQISFYLGDRELSVALAAMSGHSGRLVMSGHQLIRLDELRAVLCTLEIETARARVIKEVPFPFPAVRVVGSGER